MKYIKLLFLSLSFAATFTACDMTDFGDIITRGRKCIRGICPRKIIISMVRLADLL